MLLAHDAQHASLLTDSCAHAPPHRDLASKLNSALLSRDGARACLTCRNLRILGCRRRRARTREQAARESVRGVGSER